MEDSPQSPKVERYVLHYMYRPLVVIDLFEE